MIRFSAIVSVVAVALGLLVAGAVSGTLILVYLAIGVASVALILLVAGVLIWRDEVFGEQAGTETREQVPAGVAVGSEGADRVARGARGGDHERGYRPGVSPAAASAEDHTVAASAAGRHNGLPAEPARAGSAAGRGHAGEDRGRDRQRDGTIQRDSTLQQDGGARRPESDRPRHEDRHQHERAREDWAEERPGAQPAPAAGSPAAFAGGTRYQPDARRPRQDDQPDVWRRPEGQPDAPRVQRPDDRPDVWRRPEGQPDARRPRPDDQPDVRRQRLDDQPDVRRPRREDQPDARRVQRPDDQPDVRQPERPGAAAASARTVSSQPPVPAADTAAGAEAADADVRPAPEPVAERPAVTRQTTQVAPAVRSPAPDQVPDSAAAREPAASTTVSPATATATPAAGAAATGAAKPSATPSPDVTVVPGIARYHKKDCILIRFLGDEDLETMSRERAEESGCVPCRACRPEKEMAAGES